MRLEIKHWIPCWHEDPQKPSPQQPGFHNTRSVYDKCHQAHGPALHAGRLHPFSRSIKLQNNEPQPIADKYSLTNHKSIRSTLALIFNLYISDWVERIGSCTVPSTHHNACCIKFTIVTFLPSSEYRRYSVSWILIQDHQRQDFRMKNCNQLVVVMLMT